ncbi:signal recognition particle protein, partial [Streptococcus suis]
QQIYVPVFELVNQVPALEIVRQCLEKAKSNHNDYVLIDTAGRFQIYQALIAEFREIKEFSHPKEKHFVVDAKICQETAHV